MKDAESCIGLNPGFAKGYSRKGAALHALKRYNDSIAVYEEGLKAFPEDKGLKSGLAEVKRDRDAPPPRANPMGSLFGPDLMAKIAMDPKTRGHLKDEDFVSKIQLLQRDPNQLQNMMGDPRIMDVFQMILGGAGMGFGGDQDEEEKSNTSAAAPPAPPAPPAAAKTEQASPMEVEEPEEDVSDMTPEEIKIQDDKKASVVAKTRGNELYKKKDFEGAIAAYDEAIALDGTNMTFLSNKAAVYFTQKMYDECIEACNAAVEVGKENYAPFEDRAKALTRCGKAYHKKGDTAQAIATLKSAQLEHFDKATQRLLKNMELEKKKADAIAYQSDELAEEAKQRGNDHFRNKKWGDAVLEYEDAVKRAPKNAAIRNNLSAALCKVMDFNGAKRAIEVALDLDPKYTKAWARKGDIEVLMKENHKAMDSYKKGLAIDPNNAACKEGLRKVANMVNMGSANMTEEERKERAEHGMADPEIQGILSDPVIRQILQDFNDNPDSAQAAMRNPTVRAKIEKLIAAGVLQTA
mmetsp:Transcript_33646/g.49467  ORF Transcript_33646/g.49467 Transcript_33646/m.49467 type:complete len:522 (-) Transcript_33646:451-2016(-)